MGDLRNNFFKSTGLTYDIEKFLENLPEDQKIKMFKKLKWQINSGILMDNVKSEKTENGVNTIIELAQKLNISGDDLDLDGEISDDEIKISKIISSAKEKQIEITEYKKEQELILLKPILSEEELINACGIGGEYKLMANIILSDYVEIRDKEITIYLNGYSLTHPASSSATYKDVLETYGNAKLTIEGDGNLIAEDGYCIYATGDSTVILNGGKYFSPVSAVDARKNAIVTINGGEYKIDGSNNPDGDFGQKYTLNLRDKTGKYASELANFIVKGGKFFNFDPSKSEAEPTITNFVEDGYRVIKNGDWFEVIK